MLLISEKEILALYQWAKERKGKMKIKEKIRKNLVEAGIRHPNVWKGFSASTHEHGWHFREFGEPNDVFLGKNWTEVQEYLEE
jgi:hypothetical protein